MTILISNEIIKYEKHELCHDTTHGHLSRTSWLHTLNDAFREVFYYCWLQPLGTAGFSTARRTKLSDCCFGKLNDLKQTQPDCAAVLGNAMTLTALLSAVFLCCVEIKISLNPENHISQSTADPLGSPFKSRGRWGQLQCSKGYLQFRFRICQVVALYAHQSVHYTVLDR